jgi:PH domain associated with Beige/BEACH
MAGVDHKLRPLLQPGDEVLRRLNCELVSGMDSRAGVLLFCRRNLYMIENYRIVEDTTDAANSAATSTAQDALARFRRGVTRSPNRADKARGLTGEVVELVAPHNPWGSHDTGSSGQETYATAASTAAAAAAAASGDSGSGSGTVAVEAAPIAHPCSCWSYSDVGSVHRRRFLLRHVAIEVICVCYVV